MVLTTNFEVMKKRDTLPKRGGTGADKGAPGTLN